MGALLVIVRRRRRIESSPVAAELSPEERERLATLLDRKDP